MTSNGQTVFRWRKRGRIFFAQGQYPWMMSHAQNPCALILDDRIRVYFTCRPRPDKDGQFTSVITFIEIDRANPLRILTVHDRPLLEPGPLGAFDEFGSMPGAVLRVGDEVWMYYAGWMRCYGAPYSHALGLAISRDGGITFERHGAGPVITRTPNEPYLQNSPFVWLREDGFEMWYSSATRWLVDNGRPESVYVLMHATSRDGIHWERDGVPILPALSPAECQTSPSLLAWEGKFHLWFSHRHGTDFRNRVRGYRGGYAISDDLRTWTRRDELSLLEPSETGWDSEMICYPNAFLHGEELWMLYSGNHFGRDGFGLATIPLSEVSSPADNAIGNRPSRV